ncbi:MAG: hypothetical protein NVS1B10_07860 [Candidatus Saccharimonadales bacterium]
MLRMKYPLIPLGYDDSQKLTKRLKVEDEEHRNKLAEDRVIGLFKSMSERVPAYKDFL